MAKNESNRQGTEKSECLGESISRSTHPSPSAALENNTPNDFSAYMQRVPEKTQHRGWYKPGNLPHFDTANIYQFVTYRLADSLPQIKIQHLESELKNIDPKRIDSERRRMIEQALDAGHGSCVLKYPECAQCVIDSWKHYDGSRYRLMAWTVMPNHVHILFQQLENYRLADIISSWKKFTARRTNALIEPGELHGSIALQINMSCSGEQLSQRHLWHRDYWDRFIRNEEHYHSAIDYILNNAVKAGLAKKAEDWPWCGTALD